MLVPRDIGDSRAVDRQPDDQIGSKIRRPLHNQTRAWVSAGGRTRRGDATARLDLSSRDCDRANQSENPKDPKIVVHPSNVTASNLLATFRPVRFSTI
jgi:hypothetical protein